MDQGIGPDLEKFRPYLHFLAQVNLDPRLKGKLDPSDIVQQTLLEIHEKKVPVQGESEGQFLAWLRTVLAHNLADALRAFRQAKRDVARERSLEEAVQASSARLEKWLAADQSTPSQEAVNNERAVILGKAMAHLPESQREVLVLQHWQGWSLAQIADHIGRTPAAVAGLIKRGLHSLREYLGDCP